MHCTDRLFLSEDSTRSFKVATEVLLSDLASRFFLQL
ncbi:unnamed protein product [Ixodes pacificus]